MRVEREGQAVVTDVVGGVAGLGHAPEGDVLEGHVLGLALGGFHEAVKSLSRAGTVERALDLISEASCETFQAFQLLGIWEIMDTVDEGLGLLGSHAVHLSVGSNELGHGAIRQKHELLDEPVGLLGEHLVHVDRTALGIYLDLHFRTVEIHRSGIETLLLENLSERVQNLDCLFNGRFSLLFLDNILSLLIVKTIVGIDYRAAYPAVLDIPLRVDFGDHREGELVLVRTERAELVAEFLRQHRHGAVHEINAGAALACLLVHGGAGRNVMGHVGNMHAYLVAAAPEFAERDGVVEVLGIGRIYGKGQNLPEVLPALELFGSYGFWDAVGRVLNLLRETVGQVELGQDGMHLGFVFAGGAEHVFQHSVRVHLAAVPAVHNHRNLHPPFGSESGRRLGIDLDVVGHILALHQHPGLGADGMEDAHKLPAAALQHFDYFAFAAMTERLLAGTVVRTRNAVAGNGHTNGVAVEGPARLVSRHVHVVVLPVDSHKHETVARHADGSGFLRKDAFPGSFAVIALHGALVAFTHAW